MPSIWALSGRLCRAAIRRRSWTNCELVGVPAEPIRRMRSRRRLAAGRRSLWRFTSVGHIGKVGGPKAWMEPVTPIVARQELRMKMPADGGRRSHTLPGGGRRRRRQ